MKTRLRASAGLLVLLLLAWTAPASAQTKRVLILHSLDRGNLTMDGFTGSFRINVEQRSGTPVTFMQAVVNPAGFAISPQKPVVEYLASAFANQPKPDLLVTIGGPAAVFARKFGRQLFPDVPILLTSVSTQYLRSAPLADYETAVATQNDMAAIVDDILRLFPETTNVFMVMGSGPLGRFWRQEMERDFARFRGRVNFIWSDNMSFAEILGRVATLPPRSAVFFLTWGTDGQGGAYPEDRVLAEIHAVSTAPLFGALSPELGHGIVGGSVMDVDRLARTAADVALRLLDGEPPAGIRAPPQLTGPAIFDARELERWRIDESLLPAGSTIRFKVPGVWERFKWGIVGATAVLIGQSFLIGTLLVSRAKRRRAEQLLRENVADLDAARGALSNLSRRLMEAQEVERSRVARELHDDVSQRLSFFAMDLARLRATLPAGAADIHGQAQGLYDSVIALGRDVQLISHRLHASNIDRLGLAVAGRSFCAEVVDRHELKIVYAHEGVPGRLPEGIAISLFRVLQEAVSNTAKHAAARHCRVTLHGSAEALTLEVVDDGRGFNVDAARAGHGLGLISMEERLKLVDGTVMIESNVGGGTTVRATVPLGPHRVPEDQAVSADGALPSTRA